MAWGFFDLIRRADSLFLSISGMAAMLGAMMGTSAAMASKMVQGWPSLIEGRTKMSKARRY